MSLWLVANTQRRQPVRCAVVSWSSWSWPCVVTVAVEDCAHVDIPCRFFVVGRCGLLAARASTSAGCTSWPVLLRPAVLGVGDDRGDVGVATAASRPAWRRCAAPLSTIWICSFWSASTHDRRAVERLDRAGALAVGLVAGHAVGGVDLLAARQQVGQRPDLVRIVGLGGRFLLLARRPRRCSRPPTTTFTSIGMKACSLPHSSCALAAVVADLLGAEPGVAHEAGDRVLLDAELRHGQGVDHVVGGGDDAHLACRPAPPAGCRPRTGSCRHARPWRRRRTSARCGCRGWRGSRGPRLRP